MPSGFNGNMKLLMSIIIGGSDLIAYFFDRWLSDAGQSTQRGIWHISL